MKGLALARRYYEAYGKGMLERAFPHLVNRVAVGLVGEGSECFGYDDEWSQDHDFGAGFCLFLTAEDAVRDGAALQRAYDALPDHFEGYGRRGSSPEAGKRVGVFSIDDFYSRYTSCLPYPMDAMAWLKIPSGHLATATNGEVFSDPLGQFSEVRRILLGFYPEDVRRKKLAAALAKMAQSGQYNYPRALKRRDDGAAYLACAAFVEATLQALFLLNKRYLPFYKWRFRAASELRLGSRMVQDLREAVVQSDGGAAGAAKAILLERIAVEMVQTLRREGLSRSPDDFLTVHAKEVTAGIGDVRLRSMPLIFDVE